MCSTMLAWAVWAPAEANETASHLLSQGGSPLLVAQTRAHDGAEVLLFVDAQTACVKGCFPVLQKYIDGICISNEGRVFVSPAGMGLIVTVYTGKVLVSFPPNVPTMGTKADERWTAQGNQREEPLPEDCKGKTRSSELESHPTLSTPTLVDKGHGHDGQSTKRRPHRRNKRDKANVAWPDPSSSDVAHIKSLLTDWAANNALQRNELTQALFSQKGCIDMQVCLRSTPKIAAAGALVFGSLEVCTLEAACVHMHANFVVSCILENVPKKELWLLAEKMAACNLAAIACDQRGCRVVQRLFYRQDIKPLHLHVMHVFAGKGHLPELLKNRYGKYAMIAAFAALGTDASRYVHPLLPPGLVANMSHAWRLMDRAKPVSLDPTCKTILLALREILEASTASSRTFFHAHLTRCGLPRDCLMALFNMNQKLLDNIFVWAWAKLCRSKDILIRAGVDNLMRKQSVVSRLHGLMLLHSSLCCILMARLIIPEKAHVSESDVKQISMVCSAQDFFSTYWIWSIRTKMAHRAQKRRRVAEGLTITHLPSVPLTTLLQELLPLGDYVSFLLTNKFPDGLGEVLARVQQAKAKCRYVLEKLHGAIHNALYLPCFSRALKAIVVLDPFLHPPPLTAFSRSLGPLGPPQPVTPLPRWTHRNGRADCCRDCFSVFVAAAFLEKWQEVVAWYPTDQSRQVLGALPIRTNSPGALFVVHARYGNVGAVLGFWDPHAPFVDSSSDESGSIRSIPLHQDASVETPWSESTTEF